MLLHKPSESTRQTVKLLTSVGWAQDKVAMALAIDSKTLRLHYREELDIGQAEIESTFIQTGMMKALGMREGSMKPDPDKMNVRMWERFMERFGWKREIELGGSIEVYDPSRLTLLSMEELEQLERLSLRLEPTKPVEPEEVAASGNDQSGDRATIVERVFVDPDGDAQDPDAEGLRAADPAEKV